MLDAVSEKRQWVVASRKALADFLELVDVRLLPPERAAVYEKRGAGREQPSQESHVLDIVQAMSDEQFSKLSKDRTAFERWLRERTSDSGKPAKQKPAKQGVKGAKTTGGDGDDANRGSAR